MSFKRFLGLHPADDRGDRRRGRNLPQQDILPREQRAGIADRKIAPGGFGQGAFEAGAPAGHEHPHQAQQFLDRAVDPGFVHPVAEAVDRQARLAVVEAADHRVHAADDPESQLGGDVAVQVLDVQLRVELLGARRDHFRLAAFGIPVAEEHRAAEVGRLDGVEIDHEQVPHAHQRQVLDHLVAERARADHQHLRVPDLFFFPPGDEFEGPQPVGLQVGDVERLLGGGGQAARPFGRQAFRGGRFAAGGTVASRQFAGGGQVFRVELAGEPADSGARFDEVVFLHRLERFAQSCPADFQLLDQVAFGWQLLSGLDRPVEQRGRKPAGDGLCKCYMSNGSNFHILLWYAGQTSIPMILFNYSGLSMANSSAFQGSAY